MYLGLNRNHDAGLDPIHQRDFSFVNDVLYPRTVYKTSLLGLDVDTGVCTHLLQTSLRKCFLAVRNRLSLLC